MAPHFLFRFLPRLLRDFPDAYHTKQSMTRYQGRLLFPAAMLSPSIQLGLHLRAMCQFGISNHRQAELKKAEY